MSIDPVEFIHNFSILPTRCRDETPGAVVQSMPDDLRESFKNLKSKDLEKLRSDAILFGSRNDWQRDQQQEKTRKLLEAFDQWLNS